jgi:hypothetical protein
MRVTSIQAVSALALAVAVGFPTASRAFNVAPAASYVATIENGGYQVTDPPYTGTIDYFGTPTDSVTSADIFLPDPALEFNTAVQGILSQGPSGGQYDLDLLDTTGTYELELVIDDPTALFSGAPGATVDSSSLLVTYPGDFPVGGLFTGDLVIPAPGALPVFASALGLLGIFGRRRKPSAAAA